MPRTSTTVLALSTVALTGCGPTAEDVLSMVSAGSAKAYKDALSLRADILAAGIECPGTNQIIVPPQDGTAYLECDNALMAMAVTNSEEVTERLLGGRDNTGPAARPVLHAENWMIVARDEGPLRRLQNELGGTVIPGS